MPTLDAHLSLAPVAVYLAGSLLALVDRTTGGKLSHGAALIGSLIGTVLSILALLGGATEQLGSFPIAPFATVSLRLDPLAAYFLLVISLVGVAASLYALGYLGEERGSRFCQRLSVSQQGKVHRIADLIFKGVFFQHNFHLLPNGFKGFAVRFPDRHDGLGPLPVF